MIHDFSFGAGSIALVEDASRKFTTVKIKAICLCLVALHVFDEGSVRVWIEVVGVDDAALLGRRHRKRPHTGHHIHNRLALVEPVHEPLVLGVQARVPVHFGKVKRERAPAFPLKNG